jgi:hypothetical protein
MVIVGMQHSSLLIDVHNRDEDMFVGATFFVTIKHLEKLSKCIWRAPLSMNFPLTKDERSYASLRYEVEGTDAHFVGVSSLPFLKE